MKCDTQEDKMGMRTKPPRHENYCLFDTALGPCGVAWSGRGLTRLQLPEWDRSATEQRLRAPPGSPSPGDPPPAIARAIAAVQRYLTGARVDFSSVALDLTDAGPFHRRVYEAARAVGWGHTASYGELARRAGSPRAARAVGQALSRNPIAIIIPCHRILASGNRVGGFSAFGGPCAKERLLSLEGVRVGVDAPLLPGLESVWRR
jgi:methylated-DNA-[protein]-cysteine S-methyltransferase